MVKATAIGGECCLNDQSYTTKATIKLADGLKVKCCVYRRQCGAAGPSPTTL
jgi:hypothetical protein